MMIAISIGFLLMLHFIMLENLRGTSCVYNKEMYAAGYHKRAIIQDTTAATTEDKMRLPIHSVLI